MTSLRTAGRPRLPGLPAPRRSRSAARWGDLLFPPTVRASWHPHWWAVALAALVAGTVASLLRQPGAGALDTVWAEDGRIFLEDAYDDPAGSLTEPYAGYLHVVPRLLAWLAAALPASLAAEALAVAAALVTAALAAVVFIASRGHVAAPLARLAVAAPVVLAPLAQGEVPNSIANLHWPALYASCWVLLWNPRGRGGRWTVVLVLALTALSDLLVVALLPLALLRLRAVPGWTGRAPALALGGGVALQVFVKATAGASRDLDPTADPVLLLGGYVLRVVPTALFGERWVGTDLSGSPRVLGSAAAAAAIVAALAWLAMRRRATGPLVAAAVLLAHSVVFWVLPVGLSGLATPRYVLAPALLLVAAVVVLATAATGRPGAAVVQFATRQRITRIGPLLALGALLAVVAALNFRVDNARAEGPAWDAQLRTTAAACSDAPDRAVRVPVSPRAGDLWSVAVPCAAL